MPFHIHALHGLRDRLAAFSRWSVSHAGGIFDTLGILGIIAGLLILLGMGGCTTLPPEEQASVIRSTLGSALDEAITLRDELVTQRAAIDDDDPSAASYDRLIAYLGTGIEGGHKADAILDEILNEDGTINGGAAAQTGAAMLPPPWNAVAGTVLSILGVGGAGAGVRRYRKATQEASDAESRLVRLVRGIEAAKPRMNGDEKVLLDSLKNVTTDEDKLAIDAIRRLGKAGG